MWRENTVRVSIDVTVVTLAVVFIMALLCWMNTIPRKLYHIVRSWVHGRGRSSSPRNPLPSPEPLPRSPSSDIEEIAMVEPVDDVELFLAELRLSSMTQPTLNISNAARYEFIVNLLITEKVDTTTTTTTSGYHGIPPCAICLGDYQPSDIMCSSHNSNCNHKFHQSCIFRWLLQNRNDCPCCRNNYLALSDDDDDESSVATTLDPSEISETVEDGANLGRNSPLSNDVVEMAWIPSYLAPFPPSRPTVESHVGDDPIPDPVALVATGSLLLPNSPQQLESLTVGDESNGSQSDDLDQLDPEVWSCPSVDDDDPENGGTNYAPVLRNKIRIPSRSTIGRSFVSQARYNSNDEQTQSLQLDDLILEGLMRRLQARTGSHNLSRSSSSSSSVYTEGSTDLDVPTPKKSIVVGTVAREESEMCAICRADYAVNEELCWSQDPVCTHVFHRSCMQQWIRDGHDFCPFCRAHNSDVNQQPSSNTATVDNSETVPDQQDYPTVSSFMEAERGDKGFTECCHLTVNEMDSSSAGTETSFLDTDLDILAEV